MGVVGIHFRPRRASRRREVGSFHTVRKPGIVWWFWIKALDYLRLLRVCFRVALIRLIGILGNSFDTVEFLN